MKVLNTKTNEIGAIKIVVAGEAGNGKTSLAKTLQAGLGEKVLVISAEAGLLSLRNSDIDFVELQQEWSEEKKAMIEVPKTSRVRRLADILSWIKEDVQIKKYRWIFIDSLTEIQQNVLEWLESLEDFQGPKNTIKKYGELTTQMMTISKMFRDLPSYNVVFTSLVKMDADSDGISKMKVAMIGSFADRLPALFDEILYLGVTPDKDEHGINIRKLLTTKTDKIDFPKDRSGCLDPIEPADLSHIVKKILAKPLLSDIHAKGVQAAAKVKENKSVYNVHPDSMHVVTTSHGA